MFPDKRSHVKRKSTQTLKIKDKDFAALSQSNYSGANVTGQHFDGEISFGAVNSFTTIHIVSSLTAIMREICN